MNAGDKKLNEMNRLADMGHFPASVNAGATLNILLTVLVTWWVQPRLAAPWAPVAWIALVLVFNLLPVAVLRLTLGPRTPYPTLDTMNFWRDQHKFSDWVYIAASANMAFWVLLTWALSGALHTPAVLIALLVIAVLVTFSPVLLRLVSRPRP